MGCGLLAPDPPEFPVAVYMDYRYCSTAFHAAFAIRSYSEYIHVNVRVQYLAVRMSSVGTQGGTRNFQQKKSTLATERGGAVRRSAIGDRDGYWNGSLVFHGAPSCWVQISVLPTLSLLPVYLSLSRGRSVCTVQSAASGWSTVDGGVPGLLVPSSCSGGSAGAGQANRKRAAVLRVVRCAPRLSRVSRAWNT